MAKPPITLGEESTAILDGGRDLRTDGRAFSGVLLVVAAAGIAYQAVLLFTDLLNPMRLRFPIPYAVPIFDTPFALVALGVGYLCLERHRLRHDFQSAALGFTLWLTGFLAIAHIFTQPDYPGTPGMNAGIAPYFFFSSYLAGFIGAGLAAHYARRELALSNRARLLLAVGGFVLGVATVIAVLKVMPYLPSPVKVPPGKMTPLTVWVVALVDGSVGVWALWGGRRAYIQRGDTQLFGGFLLLAVFVWLMGLLGFLISPFRYSIAWYLAGLARPIGVGIIFVGLLREQVWLYREARARLQDLEGLHSAGQALVATLDPHQIVQTITAKALGLTGADGAILFRLEPPRHALRALARAGRADIPADLEIPVEQGAPGLAVSKRRPVWTANLEIDHRMPLPGEVRDALAREGLKAVLAVPLLMQSGDVFGALAVFHRTARAFSEPDVELLAAFGTQASVAIENGRSFDQLALKARHDEALQSFAHRLLEATSEPVIVSDALKLTRGLLGADYVGLFFLDTSAGCLRLDAGLDWQPGTVGVVTTPPSSESLAGYSFLHKEPVQVEDISHEWRFATPSYLVSHGIHAGIVVPLGVREQPLGVIGAYYRSPHRFTDEDSRTLTTLADQTALAIEKTRLYTELHANLERLKETQAQLIQADKLTALGTLLSGMAHELNNPLSTIQLSVQLLKRHEFSEAVRRRIDAMEEECERASRIIRDLLVFARRKPPERRHVELTELIASLISLQAPRFELDRIRVVNELQPVPGILADPHQLQQVFLNLFTNATHAMKSARGRGTLTVRSWRRGEEIGVEVEDDGPGIPAEHLGRIFDPFFTTKAAGEGTGLGLSLSIGIVEAHAGRMTASNVPGGGARFIVTLPIAAGDKSSGPTAPEPAGPQRRGRVLLVDDEVTLRETLAEVFASLGHQVTPATFGDEALRALEQQEFDVIALDLRLPDLDGKTLWERIRETRPALASRVVFMTGDTMSPELQTFIQDAGRPVLTKPFNIDRIGRLVGDVLEANAAGP